MLAGAAEVGAARALGAGLEAAQPLVRVRDEPDFALLAIVDDVQADGCLPLHDLCHGLAHAGVERGLVELLALLARLHLGEEVRRPGEAPDVGGEHPVGTLLHVQPPIEAAAGFDLAS